MTLKLVFLLSAFIFSSAGLSHADGYDPGPPRASDPKPIRELKWYYHLWKTHGYDSRNPQAQYHAPQEKIIDFDTQIFGLCLAHVTEEVALEILLVPTIDYHSVQYRPQKPGPRGLTPGTPDLMAYLKADETRSSEWVSGFEGQLKAWVLSQGDSTVNPISIYRESLTLNRGNIWNAILTIHQLMRDNARWWDSPRYQYVSSKAAEEAFFNKLVDIRGDLAERGQPFVGDHAGSWYRLWGMMLYRLSLQGETYLREHLNIPGVITGKDQGFPSWFQSAIIQEAESGLMGWGAEHRTGKILGDLDYSRKSEIDVVGARSVTQMIQALMNPAMFKEHSISAAPCGAPSFYLIPRKE